MPWLGAAVDDPLFVPILVPGMELDRLQVVSARLAEVLADLCLPLAGTRLGVTAPSTLQHWVGYPALIYR